MSASSEKKRRQAEREQGVDKRADAQREAEEKAKKSQLKWRLGTAAIVVFVALCIILNTSLPFQMTAVKVGSENLSAAEMNYFYANAYYNYSSYFSMFGVDTTAPLGSQNCPLMEDGTWRDFLLQEATESARTVEALYQDAVANGYTLSEAGQTAVDEAMAELPEYAQSYGYSKVNDYLKALYGTGVNEALLRERITKGNLVNEYVSAKAESFTYTDDELNAYYQEHIADFVTYDYLYYYIAAETEEVTDEEGNTSSAVVEGGIDAALETAKELAAKVNDQASFEAAVAEYKEGATVQTISGYTASSVNSAYGEWITAADRQTGDVTTATSDTGAYVVMYVGMEDNMYNGVNMRHILIQTVDTDEDGTYSEEEQAEAKAKIEEIEKEWLAGDQTAEAFAALAEKYSEDEGSSTNGGLYEEIGKGSMVEEIDAFLFTEGRKTGDTAILHGNNGSYDGYHLVYFAGAACDYRLTLAESAARQADYNEWETGVTEQYTATTGGMGYNLIGK